MVTEQAIDNQFYLDVRCTLQCLGFKPSSLELDKLNSLYLPKRRVSLRIMQEVYSWYLSYHKKNIKQKKKVSGFLTKLDFENQYQAFLMFSYNIIRSSFWVCRWVWHNNIDVADNKEYLFLEAIYWDLSRVMLPFISKSRFISFFCNLDLVLHILSFVKKWDIIYFLLQFEDKQHKGCWGVVLLVGWLPSLVYIEQYWFFPQLVYPSSGRRRIPSSLQILRSSPNKYRDDLISIELRRSRKTVGNKMLTLIKSLKKLESFS